jgi:hypothetical protein
MYSMREFKKPDVTAPRFRPETKNVLSKEFFNLFKKKYPKYKEIDNKDLRKIIKKFNQVVFQTVIENRDGVQLPEQIGWLFIGTCQQSKKENVDYAKSLKYGVRVTNKNWDSDGKLAKIFFSNHALKHKIKNREFWSFIACREFKRSVAKSYPENWQMYVEVSPEIKLQWAYSRTVYKDLQNKKTANTLQNYNEFDL